MTTIKHNKTIKLNTHCCISALPDFNTDKNDKKRLSDCPVSAVDPDLISGSRKSDSSMLSFYKISKANAITDTGTI